MSAGASRIAAPPGGATARTPRVWALVEGRAGDDGQVRELAAALGWPVTELALRGNSNWHLVVDRVVDWLGLGRRPVRLPEDVPGEWPDLVVAVAGRSVSTVRRIVRASGGRTRTVHLGRPVAALADFDLVITTPQYGLPDRDNVVVAPIPFGARAATADPRAAERFAHLPRPWTALLVGGDSGSYRIGRQSVDRLLAAARAAVAAGGSVLVTTSPRTPAAAVAALGEGLPERSFFYAFERDDPNNPYAALLALADRFVVTGESASLIAEAARTGRPVSIVPVEERLLASFLVAVHRGLKRGPLGPWLDALAARGLWMPPRDLRAIHERVGTLASGRAAAEEVERLVERVRALAEPEQSGG